MQRRVFTCEHGALPMLLVNPFVAFAGVRTN